MPPTHRWLRTVDTSQHFCPHGGCRYRGWLGRRNLRANGHPHGGHWHQCQCTADPVTKLLVDIDGGKCTQAMAQRFVHHVAQVLAPDSAPVPDTAVAPATDGLSNGDAR